MLKAAIDTKIRVNGWANTAVTRIQKRYANLDRGQTAFEYLGIILVVVALILAIVASGIGAEITKKIKEQVEKIKAG
ncbi:hypothetical protein [Streptomyces sp. NPDC086023]|uniref:hypothetical protein n=1 Tax=Streptomyces sp. NPDC086023 TaxID=3365746 RepID=UPI0037D32F83